MVHAGNGDGVAARLDAIIAQRKALLPAVDAQSVRWAGISEALTGLNHALQHLREHPDASAELVAALEFPDSRVLHTRIAQIEERYRKLAARFARTTITLAVSGQARMGKSLTLRSICGLGDDQIPVSSGIPVTATRSKIENSDGEARAVVSLHDERTFLDTHVRPYHLSLSLPSPETLAEFEVFDYPPVDSLENPGDRELLQRVRAHQQALPSYRSLLTGGDRRIPVADLRPFVAYPTVQQESLPEVDRRYLAVREARIQCPFVYRDAGSITLFDLPGLGEVMPDAERHHVEGLRDEADVILLVKSALEGQAYWNVKDRDSLKLLDEVRGEVRRAGDLVVLMVNRYANVPDSLHETLKHRLLSEALAGSDQRHFMVVTADASDPESVNENVLLPVLHHLTAKLPVMDGDLLQAATTTASTVAAEISERVEGIRTALHHLRGHASFPTEVMDDRAKKLRSALAAGLQEAVLELRVQTEQSYEDKAYLEAIEKAHEGIREWIALGLGYGERPKMSDESGDDIDEDEEVPGQAWGLPGESSVPGAAAARDSWVEAAITEFRETGTSVNFAAHEFNRIRVEVGRRFGAVDTYFTWRVEQLHDRVGQVLKQHTGALLSEVPDKQGEVLRAFVKLLHEGYEPCPDLARTVEDLLNVRLDYRTLLYPAVRNGLGELRLEIPDPVSRRPVVQIAVELNEAGAQELYEHLSLRAEEAAFQTAQDLYAKSVLPGEVLFAVAELFEDTLIRSGDSAREFKRFVRTYRNDLWPDKDGGLAGEHARFAAVSRACDHLKAVLALPSPDTV